MRRSAGVRKIAVWVISIIGLCIVFLIYDFFIATPTITVENVKLIEAKPPLKENERSYVFDYAINEDDKRRLIENNTRIIEALITFKYDHQSFLKTIYLVRGRYATPENLPPIIAGNKPDMATVEGVKIYSRMYARKIYEQKFRMTVLIDPKNYSDAEILEMLKTVKVNIVAILDERKGDYKVLATLPLATLAK
jgi:hypothetical protein